MSLHGMFIGDDIHDAYGWVAPPEYPGYLTVLGIDKLLSAASGASCSEVLSTGGGPPSHFIAGAADGLGSVTAMASDALYVVDVMNEQPDDLHYPVYGLQTTGFLDIFYTQ